MKVQLIVVLSTCLVILTLMCNTVLAQSALVGVSEGEIFDYTYSFHWSSTNPSATIPSEYLRFNDTQLIRMKVTEISGTRVNLECTKYFKNGTQSTDVGYIDVYLGVIEIPYGYLIISANLSVNQIFPPSGGHQSITSSYLKEYASGQREVNRFLRESDIETTKIDFDKLKGVAFSYYYELRDPTGGYITTIKEIITNSNYDVWTATNTTPNPISTSTPTSERTTAPTQSVLPTVKAVTPSMQQFDSLISILMLAVVVVIVVVAVLLLVKGRGRKRKSRVDDEFAEYLKPKKP